MRSVVGLLSVLSAGCLDTVLVGAIGPVSDSIDGGAGNRDSDGAPWQITFFDDFEGAAGAAPSPERWTFDVGANTWGPDQAQHYTPRRANSYLDGQGNLIIEAKSELYMGSAFTSARLKTQGLFAQRYGRFEIRARIPAIRGLSASFWLMGDDFPNVGWPECGDINVMSVAGDTPQTNRGGLHGPGFGFSDSVRLPYVLTGADFGGAAHLFAVEWQPDQIRFFVDDVMYGVRTSGDLPADGRWVQDHPFFLVLHLAVHRGEIVAPLAPQQLIVEFVRVSAR